MCCPPPYLKYLTFGANCVSLVGQLISIPFMSYILYCVRFNKKKLRAGSLSKSMIIYLVTDVIASSVGLLDGFYMVVQWDSNIQKFDMVFVFWNGILLLNYLTISPVPIFFLMLDRCVALRFGLSEHHLIRKALNYYSISVIIIIYFGSFGVYLLELPIPEERYKRCTIFACLIVKYNSLPQLFTRFLFTCMNLACTCYFLYLMRLRNVNAQLQNYHKSVQTKNRVVKITAIIEIFLTIIPTFFSSFVTIAIEESSSNYFGPNSMYVTIQSALCSITYFAIVLKDPVPLNKTNKLSVLTPAGTFMPTRPLFVSTLNLNKVSHSSNSFFHSNVNDSAEK